MTTIRDKTAAQAAIKAGPHFAGQCPESVATAEQTPDPVPFPPNKRLLFVLYSTTKFIPSMTTGAQLRREFFGNIPRIEPGGIRPYESWWVERQKALEQAGYMLRPRYHPDWKPSWAGTHKDHDLFEDGQVSRVRSDMPVFEFSALINTSVNTVHRRDSDL